MNNYKDKYEKTSKTNLTDTKRHSAMTVLYTSATTAYRCSDAYQRKHAEEETGAEMARR